MLPHSPVLAASADTSVGLIRWALEAGASDFITLPLTAPELHRVLIKFTQLERRPGAPSEPGEVITLCAARGGLGVTTLAVNLAVRLHGATGSTVTLVDLDLQRGDVTAYLDMAPMESVASLAGARDKLDEVFLRATLARHPSGIFVLAAPVNIEEADLVGHEELAAAIPLLRAQFRYTVIDTSRTITGAVLAALELADRILLLTDLSVPGVRAARRLHELLAHITPDPDRIQLLISQTGSGPVKMADALKAIGKDQALLVIPRDDAKAAEAMNTGAPLNGAAPSALTDGGYPAGRQARGHACRGKPPAAVTAAALLPERQKRHDTDMMRIRPRLGFTPHTDSAPRGEAPPPVVSVGRMTAAERAYQDLKLRIHRELLQRLDLNSLARTDIDEATSELRNVIAQLISEQTVPLSLRDREQLRDEILNEVRGLGPIEPLLQDPGRVRRARQHVATGLHRAPGQARTHAGDLPGRRPPAADHRPHRVARRPADRRELADGRRAAARRLPRQRHHSAARPRRADPVDSPIRTQPADGRGPDSRRLADAGDGGAAPAMVRARLNILISGGTGSGKTTLLNCLSSFIPETERIVTIEDSAELQLQQPHVVRLETRPSNIEGKGEVTQRELVRNSLRMRPDRIVVGEVRGGEALDMLQAMNTGHDGSISTIHANSARDALHRLEMMIQLSGVAIPMRAMRQQISSALNVIIHTARLPDGSRKVMSISELAGLEGDTIMLQDLFVFRRECTASSIRVHGYSAAVRRASQDLQPRHRPRRAGVPGGLRGPMFGIAAVLVFLSLALAGYALAGVSRTREDAAQAVKERLRSATGWRDGPRGPRYSRTSACPRSPCSTPCSGGCRGGPLSRMIQQAGLSNRVGEIILYIPLLAFGAMLLARLFTDDMLIATSPGRSARRCR